MAIGWPDMLQICLRITMLLLAGCTSVLRVEGGCQFPDRWIGQWFQSGIGSPVKITATDVSTKGECIMSSGEKFLIHDTKEHCYRCVAIRENHVNVLQYKETFCDENNYQELCNTMQGDGQLFSMFRVNSSPEACPFKGPFTFTYSRGIEECKNPVSNIDTCTDDWRMLLRFQACADVPGTESTVEELVCLAHWKDGSTKYLVGKLEHKMTNIDEEKYRCFVYEKNTENDHSGFKLAQSGDATCNGLFSPTEGSRTMKLNKTHYSAKCQFPPWLVHSQHWHTLDGRKLYSFSHKNKTLSISNYTLGSSSNPLESKIYCLEEVSVRDKTSIFIAQMTAGCKIGYICMVFHNRGHHVVELQKGQLTLIQEEACNPPFFERTSTEFETLITTSPKAKQCPYLGKYNLLNAKWQYRHEREICQGFSTLRVGCDRVDTIEFETDCPTEQKIETYECHANWHENGTNYLIASVKGTRNRYCFVYLENNKILQFSSLQDSCKRNIQPGVAGVMAFNVTSNGHCNEVHDGVSSSHETVMPVFLFVIELFLLMR